MGFTPHQRLTVGKVDLDPVCGMPVGADALRLEYMGFVFRFCSRQCQERFEAHPQLYVGHPGEVAPRQRGERIPKRRRFMLATQATPEQAEAVCRAVRTLMGILECQVEGSTVWVSYDLMQTTARQIAKAIAQAGVPLDDSLPVRMSLAALRYLEESELVNREQGAAGEDQSIMEDR